MGEETISAALRAAMTADAPLAGPGLDRADPLRRDAAGLAEAAARADAGWLDLEDGRAWIALSDAGARLAWTHGRALGAEDALLGRSGDGAARFARSVGPEAAAPAVKGGEVGGGAEVKRIDLRSIARDLTPSDAAIYAQAKSLLAWHDAHPHCSRCGAATVMEHAGWRRGCPNCGARHFPRTDPVVIMLVLGRAADGEEMVVLGRQHAWPPGLHSLLAGYVEPGETIEAAVRRETFEEAGLRVGRVAYAASQPWPFPSTLMIGCVAEALDRALTPDREELESVLWARRSDVAALLAGRAAAALPDGAVPARPDAIAHALLKAWVARELGL